MITTQRPRRVIITGASTGIGAALARRYAATGAVLGLIARRKDLLERLAAEIPGSSEVYPLDVRDAVAMADAARDFIGRHGCPDAVIANAGVSVGTLSDFPEDTRVFQELLDVNVIGIVNTFQPFIGPMRAQGNGALVGIASIAGYRGLPGAGAYSASKAAAIAYLESLRVELRASGVSAITICPGYVETAMTGKNPYPMPFLMSAEMAAAKIAALIERGKLYSVIPWQMAVVARALRVMPNWLYDRAFANVARKPRRNA
ncbi:MAG TPA: SDR family oxidoreductase [Burkholderiales bacterium]|nr:SDR family oxidoreductase [Burkholderiales bacterium]